MRIKNYPYYMTLSQVGLRFMSVDDSTDNAIYKLEQLNAKGLRFVAAIRTKNKATEIEYVVAIFEKEEDESLKSKR